MNVGAELEQLLTRAECATAGDWGEPIVRSPAKLFAQQLKRQGFLPSQEFVVRFMRKLQDCGGRLDARAFRNEFYRARHYRQTGSRHKPRIAVIRGVPVLYHSGGDDRRVMLLGVLPEYASPCVVAICPPPARVANAPYESGLRYR
jgi:hypothetical protein